jgi:hypothetical protein
LRGLLNVYDHSPRFNTRSTSSSPRPDPAAIGIIKCRMTSQSGTRHLRVLPATGTMSNACTYCLAVYPTNELLLQHLGELRVSEPRILFASTKLTSSKTQENYHSIELDRYRTHLQHHRDNGYGTGDEEGHSAHKLSYFSSNALRERICPHIECTRTENFQSQGKLERHFQIRILLPITLYVCLSTNDTIA